MVTMIGSFLAPGADLVASQLVAFSLFWMSGVSMSLFSRAIDLDGGGIHFNTEVFCKEQRTEADNEQDPDRESQPDSVSQHDNESQHDLD